MDSQRQRRSAALRDDVYHPARFAKRETAPVNTSACRACSRPVLREKSGLTAHLDAIGTALCAGSVRLSPEDALVRISAEKRVRRKYRLTVCSSCRQLVTLTSRGNIKDHEGATSRRCEVMRRPTTQPQGATIRLAPADAHDLRHRQTSSLLEYERLVRLEILHIARLRKKQLQRKNPGFRGLTTEELRGRSPSEQSPQRFDQSDVSIRPYFDRPSVSVTAVNGGSPGSSRRKF